MQAITLTKIPECFLFLAPYSFLGALISLLLPMLRPVFCISLLDFCTHLRCCIQDTGECCIMSSFPFLFLLLASLMINLYLLLLSPVLLWFAGIALLSAQMCTAFWIFPESTSFPPTTFFSKAVFPHLPYPRHLLLKWSTVAKTDPSRLPPASGHLACLSAFPALVCLVKERAALIPCPWRAKHPPCFGACRVVSTSPTFTVLRATAVCFKPGFSQGKATLPKGF